MVQLYKIPFLIILMLLANSLKAIDKEFVINRINELRAKDCMCGKEKMRTVSPIIWNNLLEEAAQAHANDMHVKKYFSHKSPKGSTPLTRVEKTGYIYVTLAENIAKGQKTESEVIEGWMNSPGHCKNIMLEGIKEIALAKSGEYWVLVLAG